MRTTKQKNILLQAIQSSKSFFDAAALHKQVLTIDHRIGIATTYRFLKQLEEKGEVHSYLCANRKIYSVSKQNHVHFTCESCGKMTHLTLKNVDFLKQEITDEICHFQIDLVGVCKECAKKQKKSV